MRLSSQLCCKMPLVRTFAIWPSLFNGKPSPAGESYDFLRVLNRKTRSYIDSENLNCRKVMASTHELQRKMYTDLIKWQCPTGKSVPELIGGYWYYTKSEKGKEFSIHCRIKDEFYRLPDNRQHEEVILNANALLKQFPYVAVNIVKLSADHKFLAYTLDTDGSETYTLYIKDIASGTLLDVIANVTNVEWLAGSNDVVYSVPDALRRPCKVFIHRIGTPTANDKLIFSDDNDKFFVDVLCTKDKKFLTVHCNSKNTSEVYLVESQQVWTEPLHCVKPRVEGIEYYLDHRGSTFYIVTNADGAFNYKIALADEKSLFDSSLWRVALEHNANVKIEDIDLFHDYMVLYERVNSLPVIRVFQLDANGVPTNPHNVSLPADSVCSIAPGVNIDFKKKSFRFEYSSPIEPHKICEYNMETKELNCLVEMGPQGIGFNSSSFVSQRLFIQSSVDGVSIPVTLSYHRRIPFNGENPLLLKVYGAYGHNCEVDWKSEEAYLMSQGFIVAIAHVRGGGELGKMWHLEGTGPKKKNSFHDFMDVLEYLCKNNYTRPALCAAVGHSAGGLVIGTCLNLGAAKYLQAAIAKVPFVDVLSAMTDKSLPLTTHEFDEWGDPEDKDVFENIRSYDPFLNLSNQNYPNMLVTASTIDIRVPYWGPLKWTVKMREMKRDSNMLILKVDDDVGHFGEGGLSGRLTDTVFEYAFLFKALKLKLSSEGIMRTNKS